MVPIAGPVRQGVGLLGSPCFEIPRSGERHEDLERLATGAERQRRLAAKLRHNAVTMGLHLLVRFLFISALVLVAVSPIDGGTGLAGMAGTAASEVLDIAVIPIVLFALVERASTGFRSLEPKVRSIYQRDFWRHERYWKVPSTVFLRVFDGTPFKNLVWRLLGVRIGGRVLDDGCSIVERTLVTLGREATLNMGTFLQSHSLEDGIFKSDRLTIGRGATVDTGAFVHYGVTMNDGSTLEADSFLMKGSELPEGARWRGNPATEVPQERE
jgi:non-ribosomal peptide synthetase-like protein